MVPYYFVYILKSMYKIKLNYYHFINIHCRMHLFFN